MDRLPPTFKDSRLKTVLNPSTKHTDIFSKISDELLTLNKFMKPRAYYFAQDNLNPEYTRMVLATCEHELLAAKRIQEYLGMLYDGK